MAMYLELKKEKAMKSLIITVGLLFGAVAQAHGGNDHGAPMTHLVFANGEIHAHAAWQSGPEVSKESLLKIEWKNGADHSPTEPPGTFEVVLWMPLMGHGSAKTQIQRVMDDQGQPLAGVFAISNIYFIMGGDWDVNVALTFADGKKETHVIKVSLPMDGGGHNGHD